MPHVSYSELKNWYKCPFYHKLTYIDKIRLFQGNEHTAFGSAVHKVCEDLVLKKTDAVGDFKKLFLEELKRLPEDYELRKDLVQAMKKQGPELVKYVVPALKRYFKKFEVISVEESLMEEVKDFPDKEYNFKGYIDLVLKTADGRYQVIDWKTCSWGWDARKKSDKMMVYQLIFYKYYLSQKYDISPENIDVYFGLLKRTIKNSNKVEFVKVTSGEKRIQNAINFLNKALYNINKKNYMKNRLSCEGCEFKKTVYCP